MKTILSVLTLAALFSGCVPKSELDTTRDELAIAQQKIATLEAQRVPRSELDAAQSAAAVAEERVTLLLHDLENARAQLEAQEKLELERQLALRIAGNAETPRPAGLVLGTFEASNGTRVYSPDAVLNFGPDLQITSATGLMVSDPEEKIVGGELNITAKDVVLETTDGLLMTQQDGSVTFTGNSLTLKSAGKKPEPSIQPNQP